MLAHVLLNRLIIHRSILPLRELRELCLTGYNLFFGRFPMITRCQRWQSKLSKGFCASFFSMAPIVYRSPLPSIPLYAHSIFTHLFSSVDPNDVGGFNASLPAFIDTVTGTTLTRGQLRKLALALGYGLQKHPTLSAKRGDTVMIYSQNSLAWPVVIFGSGMCFRLEFKLWSIKVHSMFL